jgi:hypothetical protein
MNSKRLEIWLLLGLLCGLGLQAADQVTVKLTADNHGCGGIHGRAIVVQWRGAGGGAWNAFGTPSGQGTYSAFYGQAFANTQDDAVQRTSGFATYAGSGWPMAEVKVQGWNPGGFVMGSAFTAAAGPGAELVVVMNGSGVISLSVTAPPVIYDKWDWASCVTNTTGFVGEYRFTYSPSFGADVVTERTLQPGEIWCQDKTKTNTTFNAGFGYRSCQEENFGCVWIDNLTAATHGTTTNTPPAEAGSESAVAGNIWDTQTATNRLGSQSAPTYTANTRTNVSGLTGDTLQIAKEANDDQRFAELRSLMIDTASKEAIRDTVALDSFNRGIGRLISSVDQGTLSTSNLLSGLGRGGTPSGGGVTNLPGWSGLGDFTNAIPDVTFSWLPDPGSLGQEPWAVEFPVGVINPGSSSVTVSMAGNPLASAVATMRAVILTVVTLLFIYSMFKVTAQAGGVQ